MWLMCWGTTMGISALIIFNCDLYEIYECDMSSDGLSDNNQNKDWNECSLNWAYKRITCINNETLLTHMEQQSYPFQSSKPNSNYIRILYIFSCFFSRPLTELVLSILGGICMTTFFFLVSGSSIWLCAF